ncbi:DNA pilot protein [Dipodfec virus UOA04_Rod_880]|nr:DNA pilot protein [Dipodfec virus UOA04_Rod_880]
MVAEILGIAGAAASAINSMDDSSVGQSIIQTHLQNKFNVAQWERNNEYNSPIRQMERIKSAGLNPNLVYGEGVSGNNSSSPVRSAVPTPTRQSNAGSVVAQGAMSVANMIANQRQFDAKLNQEREIAAAQLATQKFDAETRRMSTTKDNEVKDFNLKFAQDTRDDKIRELQLSNELQNVRISNETLAGQLTEKQIAGQNLANQKLEEELKLKPLEAQYLTEKIRGQILSNTLAMDTHRLNSIAIEIAEKTKDANIKTALAQASTEQEKARVVAQYFEQETMQRIASGDLKLEGLRNEGDEFHYNVMGIDVGRVYQSVLDSFGLVDYYYPESYKSYSSRYNLGQPKK